MSMDRRGFVGALAGGFAALWLPGRIVSEAFAAMPVAAPVTDVFSGLEITSITSIEYFCDAPRLWDGRDPTSFVHYVRDSHWTFDAVTTDIRDVDKLWGAMQSGEPQHLEHVIDWHQFPRPYLLNGDVIVDCMSQGLDGDVRVRLRGVGPLEVVLS